MILTEVRLDNVRNLSSARLAPSPRVNVITGDNGSGKTTLLEAIHLLGTGRSFRSATNAVISEGAAECTVFGTFDNDGVRHQAGFTRNRGGERSIHIDGHAESRASALATLLPLLFIGPSTVELLTGSPEERRRFLNWGVFHVEHERFQDSLRRCDASLRQRNALLRRGQWQAGEMDTWEQRLHEAANEVDEQRTVYFERLTTVFETVIRQLTNLKPVVLEYYRGWGEGDLNTILAASRALDTDRGFSQAGPHRADIRIRHEGRKAVDKLSRGELKLVAWGLTITQGLMAPARPAVLVDDLPSELDQHHGGTISQLLLDSNAQLFVTAIQQGALDRVLREQTETRMFHVEHGVIGEQ